MSKNDGFRIYDTGQKDSYSILMELLSDDKENGKKSLKNQKKANGITKRIKHERKKLLDIVKTDLVLEYRFALTYLEKIRSLNWKEDEKTIKLLVRLASHSMAYSAGLSPLIEKLGEESGKIQLPYAIDVYPVEKIISSHLLLEKKILKRYEQALVHYTLDDWLHKVLSHVIENKTKNLKDLKNARMT